MVPALHCDSEATWQHGNSLVNYMKMVEVEGLTGPVKFDQVQCCCTGSFSKDFFSQQLLHPLYFMIFYISF